MRPRSKRPPGARRIISLSLFGTAELYWRGAAANVWLARRYYPDWGVRIYASPEVPNLEFLSALGADIRPMPARSDFQGTYWRFLAAADRDVEYVVFRDSDSRVNPREAAAVDAWIRSGRAAHVMRDHYYHAEWPLLGGMWGCRGGLLPDIAERIERWGQYSQKIEDVYFLASEVWPVISRDCLVHTSVPEPLGGDPFPPHAPCDGHVGQVVTPPPAVDLDTSPIAPSSHARLALDAGDPKRCLELCGEAFAQPAPVAPAKLHALEARALRRLDRDLEAWAACKVGLQHEPAADDLLALRHELTERLDLAPFEAVSMESPGDLVALLLPSRGRPEQAVEAARSALATAADPARLLIAIGVEPDDAASYRVAAGDGADWIHVLRHGGNYVRAIRELRRTVAADVYGLIADDFVFETPSWDHAIRSAVAGLPGRLGLVYGNDGFQGAGLATAPFLTKDWIVAVGDVMPGRYEHLFCDLELTDVAARAGLLRYLPDVAIVHRHPFAGKAATDAVYERSRATYASGEREYQLRSAERSALARRLHEEAARPRLSVLIPTLGSRSAQLDRLLDALEAQRSRLGGAAVIQLETLRDAGEASVGAKRNELLRRALGHYVAFVDDDDEVAGTYLQQLLAATARGPDCVTFRGLMTTDGSAPLAFELALRHREWSTSPAGVALRPPNHLCAIRRAIATARSFPDVSFGEDRLWADALRPLLQSELHIPRVLYHYRFSPTGSATRALAASPG